LFLVGGKLGERSLKPSTVFIHDYGELIRLIQNDTIVINFIVPYGDDCLQINYTPASEEIQDVSKTISLIHACQTTAHGRLLLYKYLDVVGERALYHDTGTLIFKKLTFFSIFLKERTAVITKLTSLLVLQIPCVFSPCPANLNLNWASTLDR